MRPRDRPPKPLPRRVVGKRGGVKRSAAVVLAGDFASAIERVASH